MYSHTKYIVAACNFIYMYDLFFYGSFSLSVYRMVHIHPIANKYLSSLIATVVRHKKVQVFPLHTFNVDIKPSNILVNKMSDFKLSGFDVCDHLNGDGRVFDNPEFEGAWTTSVYMAVSTFVN